MFFEAVAVGKQSRYPFSWETRRKTWTERLLGVETGHPLLEVLCKMDGDVEHWEMGTKSAMNVFRDQLMPPIVDGCIGPSPMSLGRPIHLKTEML